MNGRPAIVALGRVGGNRSSEANETSVRADRSVGATRAGSLWPLTLLILVGCVSFWAGLAWLLASAL
jgi:hypothetical protein